MLQKLFLKIFAPIIMNKILSEITADRVKEVLSMGLDEAKALIVSGFDYLAAKAAETDNTFDDKAVAFVRSMVLDMMSAASSMSELLAFAEMLAVGLLRLSERTDNDYDNRVAQGILDAVRAAKV